MSLGCAASAAAAARGNGDGPASRPSAMQPGTYVCNPGDRIVIKPAAKPASKGNPGSRSSAEIRKQKRELVQELAAAKTREAKAVDHNKRVKRRDVPTEVEVTLSHEKTMETATVLVGRHATGEEIYEAARLAFDLEGDTFRIYSSLLIKPTDKLFDPAVWEGAFVVHGAGESVRPDERQEARASCSGSSAAPAG